MTAKKPISSSNLVFDESLILVKDTSQTQEEIIRKLGGLLFQSGFVDRNYIQAVLERETTFPTGLQTRTAGVAIPHADSKYVLKSAISTATLANPVIFRSMGTSEEEIRVEIVIMLAVHNAELATPFLNKVIYILENDEALRDLQKAATKTEVKQVMLKHIHNLNSK